MSEHHLCQPFRCLGSRRRRRRQLQDDRPTDEEVLRKEIEHERQLLSEIVEDHENGGHGPVVSPRQVLVFEDRGSTSPVSYVKQKSMLEEEEDEEEEAACELERFRLSGKQLFTLAGSNLQVLKGSVLQKGKPMQAVIYAIALGFVLFILISTAMELKGGDSGIVLTAASSASGSSGTHLDDGHGDSHGDDHGDDHGDAHGDDHGDAHGDGGHVDDHAEHGDDHDEHAGDHSSAGDDAHAEHGDDHGEHAGDHASGAEEDHGDDHDDHHDDHHEGGEGHGDHHDEGHGRRLQWDARVLEASASGSGASGDSGVLYSGVLAPTHQVPVLLLHIAFSLTGCGLVAFFINVAKQPLILGYLLGGVLVGPVVLNIVPDHHSISDLSSLGLIFLLFLVGLELDPKEVKEVGVLGVVAGMFQFPICAMVHIAIFTGLEAAGLSWGNGAYAAMYVGLVCSISSTMIVVKALGEKGETGVGHGKLTIGILIFQDIWAIVTLAIQPRLDNPDPLGILVIFAMIIVLITCAMAYAMFVMPAVFYYASKSVELMFVMSLAWCFFICITALLPFLGLGPELASLIAGAALATFPYSAEFNGKIKYIRDFFITLFFAGLGMQIPAPSIVVIMKAILVAIVVLLVRWLGIFVLVRVAGGASKTKIGALATINLSQISEFALVICTLGIGYEHIDNETMTIIIWTFAILAVMASYLINYNEKIFSMLAKVVNKLRRKAEGAEHHDEDHEHEHEERDIVFLGYHMIARLVIGNFSNKAPEYVKRFHIISAKTEQCAVLKEKGVNYTYGDISAADVLTHAIHGQPKLVIATTPDHALDQTNNAMLLEVSKEVWPAAKYIMTAESLQQANMLYDRGAHYVLRSSKLSAERLFEILSHKDLDNKHGQVLDQLKTFRKKDLRKSSSSTSDMSTGTN